MPTPFKSGEIPKTLARLKWAIKIMAGPDPSEILGLGQTSFELAASYTSLFEQLVEVGTVESLEIVQNKTLKERFAFGPNPLQPFQVVPQSLSVTLRMTKVMLKALPRAEQLFNFFPSNLVFQQLPFIIHLQDRGDSSDSGKSSVHHFLSGCWFQDSTIKYDVVAREDTRLIQAVTVKCARMFTLDDSIQGSRAQGVSTVIGGVVSASGAQEVIDDLGLL